MGGHEDATLYGSVTSKSCRQGWGLLLSMDFRGKMYILFQLPRIGVELFCFTVLLEPTNSRVAFVILRNDPPLIFFLGVFDFLFQLGDCLIFFSFYIT